MSQVLVSLRGDGRVGLAWVLLLTLAHPALFVSALLPSALWFAAIALLLYLGEYQSHRQAPAILGLLDKVQLNVTHRQLLRDVALLVLAARTEVYEFPILVALIMGVLTLHGLRGALIALQIFVTKRRTLPVETRNIDLSALRIPDAPPSILAYGSPRKLLHALIPVYLGVLLDVVSTGSVFGPIGLGISVVVGAVAVLVLLIHARRVRHLGDQAWIKQIVYRKIQEQRPEVVLHFSHTTKVPNSAFQVNMWLSTLANLDRRCLVIIREHGHFAAIDHTDIPIASIPSGSNLMDLELPDLKVVFYVGNVGKNIHMLRNSQAKHVFIGHGDSDKQSSVNNFNKVYDQVWVAGRAGRDRYHRARVGVRDEAIVEVGRPQLAPVEPMGARSNHMFTVLYAPTWEGWSKDMYLTSVGPMGEKIIDMLLNMSPSVRIIYKPHPLTGVANPNVGEASRRIIAKLEAANSRRHASQEWASIARETETERAQAGQRMAELDSRIAKLQSIGNTGDAAQQARQHGERDPRITAQLAQYQQDWNEAYWATAGQWSHLAVLESRPDLYSCFNQADLLISDISSVVSDFIASGKPYVITNLQSLEEAVFRAENTAAGGAYLLSPDCRQLDDILKAVQTPDGDYLAELREQTRHYLLGPDQPDAMHRFSEAVEALIAKRAAELDVTGEVPLSKTSTSLASIPGQR